jgi:hypothetical protein
VRRLTAPIDAEMLLASAAAEAVFADFVAVVLAMVVPVKTVAEVAAVLAWFFAAAVDADDVATVVLAAAATGCTDNATHAQQQSCSDV